MLSYEARQLTRTATALGVELGPGLGTRRREPAIFHLSQFTLLLHDFERAGNNIGLAYFHGRPGTWVCPSSTRASDHAHAPRRDRPHPGDEPGDGGACLSTGIAEEKVHRIPIGIDVDAFRPRDDESRLAARARFGLPGSAFVLGSFQKDGIGWGDGLEPKLIKGPDVLLAVAERVAEQVPELHVLLTGPARGYVRAGLERLGIPYRHALLPDVDAVAQVYPAIDVCLVASRDEGGPRAVLESMATRVPLVTTKVGQAADLVRHGENGWMVEPEDVDGLVEWTMYVAGAAAGELEPVLAAGRATAEDNSYDALRPRWRALLDGFVALPDA